MIQITNRNDPFYRYKRHICKTQEFKGKTVLPNLAQISHELGRPLPLLIKYIGYTVNAKTGETKGEKLPYVQGKFTAQNIEKIIDTFVQEGVLCGECNNPETKMDNRVLDCASCGHRGPVRFRSEKMLKYLKKIK